MDLYALGQLIQAEAGYQHILATGRSYDSLFTMNREVYWFAFKREADLREFLDQKVIFGE